MTPAVVEIDGLSKDYRALRPLRIEHLAVAPAESVAIVGLDRAAAETLVNLVTGAALPDAGELRVFGRPTSAIAGADEWLAIVDRCGIVTERAVLLDQLSVLQNLAMPFTLDIEPPPDDVRERAAALGSEVIEPPPDDVRERAAALGSEVGVAAAAMASAVGGLDALGRLRVRLGRALALGPSLLLLEHPNAELSKAEAAESARQIRSIAARRGIAMLAATADERYARAIADRVLMLEPATGRLRERGFGKWFRG